MAAIGKVSLRGIVHDEFQYTFLVSSATGEATEDDAGIKAVSLDTSAANTVKLATDGEKLLGRLEIYEDRVVEGIVTGMVALKGGIKFYVNPNATASPDETPEVGDNLVGAVDDAGAAGYVRKATTAELQAGKDNWLVVEVGTDLDGNDFAIAINV